MITVDDLIGKVHMQTTMHADARDTAHWFATCTEYPRLTRERVSWRREKRTVDLWFVDGAEVLDLWEAVEVMNGEKVPLGVQIEGLRRQLDAAGDDRPAIESAIKTLEWCAANAEDLRAFRASKRPRR